MLRQVDAELLPGADVSNLRREARIRARGLVLLRSWRDTCRQFAVRPPLRGLRARRPRPIDGRPGRNDPDQGGVRLQWSEV